MTPYYPDHILQYSHLHVYTRVFFENIVRQTDRTCKWEGNFLSTFCEINGNKNKTYWDTPHCITHQTLGQQPAWTAAWTWEKNPIISKSPELKQILSWKKFSLKPQWSIDNLLLEIYLLLWTQLFKELNQEFLDSGLHYITLYKELQWHLLYNYITIYIIVISPIKIISTEMARIQEFRNFVNLFAISGIHLN